MTNTPTATTHSARSANTLTATTHSIYSGERTVPPSLVAPVEAAVEATPAEAMSLDEMRMELSAIVMRLTDVPTCDFTTRIDLRERQHALRAEIAQHGARVRSLV